MSPGDRVASGSPPPGPGAGRPGGASFAAAAVFASQAISSNNTPALKTADRKGVRVARCAVRHILEPVAMYIRRSCGSRRDDPSPRLIPAARAAPFPEVHMRVGGVIVLIWLIIGAIAAGQRGYYGSSAENCGNVGTILVTIVAGPLNYAGVNPKVSCHLPSPSS